MKSKMWAALRRPVAMLCLALGATDLSAAPPSLEEDPFGTNRELYKALQENPYFKALPTAKHTLCGVSHQGETLAIYEHLPIGSGAVGTMVADYSKFENGKLVGEPWIQSGAFGGMILLRGTAAPSTAIEVTGDSLFPLLDGKSTKITLTRSNSRLEYACSTRYAPKHMDMKLEGNMYLVSCMRTTIYDNGEVKPEKPNYALCNGDLGFCPLHWVGEDGHKALFDYYETNGQRFSPVEWTCEVDEPAYDAWGEAWDD